MFDENQLIEIRWNNTNREWYKSKGYTYTKRGDVFSVKAKDLSYGCTKKVKVICDYCGDEYLTSYIVIKKAIDNKKPHACRHCASKKVHDMRKNDRIEKYYNLALQECSRRGYKLITPKYKIDKVRNHIEIETPSGIDIVYLDNFLKGHDCRTESYKYRNFKRISKDTINKRISEDGNKWLNPSEYTHGGDRCLKIKCKCGNTFTTSFYNYKHANITRCSSCAHTESLGELEVRKALEELGINYEPEKRFKDCRDKKPLPFDYYLKDYNLVIEFDGQNHFYKVFPTHEKTMEHDIIKNEYCKQKGIDILRIPYWDGHHIKEIISNKLNEIKSKDIV